VQATDDNTGSQVGSKAAMVRIRKNAQTLSIPERDRFLAALGALNAQGQGRRCSVLRPVFSWATEHSDIFLYTLHESK
jgi:hypothetical protein